MCPETVRTVLDEPSVENYMALDCGAHSLPHHATHNWKMKIHAGPLVRDCALPVKDETGRCKERKSQIFDASFEHEAWNGGDFIRCLLLLTTYHRGHVETSVLKRVNLDLPSDAYVASETVLKERENALEGTCWMQTLRWAPLTAVRPRRTAVRQLAQRQSLRENRGLAIGPRQGSGGEWK